MILFFLYNQTFAPKKTHGFGFGLGQLYPTQNLGYFWVQMHVYNQSTQKMNVFFFITYSDYGVLIKTTQTIGKSV
jgi:hypothetical protein